MQDLPRCKHSEALPLRQTGPKIQILGTRVRVRVRVRGRITSYDFSIAGSARYPYSVIDNHKSGRILIRSSLASHLIGFVTVYGKGVLQVLA